MVPPSSTERGLRAPIAAYVAKAMDQKTSFAHQACFSIVRFITGCKARQSTWHDTLLGVRA